MPAIRSRRAELPHPPTSKWGASSAYIRSRAAHSAAASSRVVYEHARLMRVRYDFLYKPIPAFAVGALDVIAESVFLNVRNRALQIALLFVEEGFPIRDEELHIANLWAVDGGIIDFVQNAVRQGEPDTAAS